MIDTSLTRSRPTESSGARWRLIDGYGSVVYDAAIRTDQTTIALPTTGTYTLLFEGAITDSTSNLSYTFNVQPVAALPSTALTLNTPVTGDALLNVGEERVYTFTGTLGQTLYFDAWSAASQQILARLEGPDGEVLFETSLSNDSGS